MSRDEARERIARQLDEPFVDHARTAGRADVASLAACVWCSHVHDPEDGRCDAHAHVGTGRCECPGVERLHEAEAHLWALVVWFGGEHEHPYINRDLAAAAQYVRRHLRGVDMTARHREFVRARIEKANHAEANHAE
jgi:hypothetical protein